MVAAPSQGDSSWTLHDCVETLRAGGLVAYPTETVWGLGACASSAAAVARLRAWKGRDEGKPISVLVAAPFALDELGFEISPQARRLIRAFWPGPLTLVLRTSAPFAPGVARADGAVGVRCSSHPGAAALAAAAQRAGLGPLSATSLNRNGESPARRREEALGLCAGPGTPRIAPGELLDALGGAPSSVVDACGEQPQTLRVGSIPASAIDAAWRGDAPYGARGGEPPA